MNFYICYKGSLHLHLLFHLEYTSYQQILLYQLMLHFHHWNLLVHHSLHHCQADLETVTNKDKCGIRNMIDTQTRISKSFGQEAKIWPNHNILSCNQLQHCPWFITTVLQNTSLWSFIISWPSSSSRHWVLFCIIAVLTLFNIICCRQQVRLNIWSGTERFVG